MGLFDPQSEAEIRAAFRRQKVAARKRAEANWDLSIDYLEGRQLEDTRQELHRRYERTQSIDLGERIQPVTIPLTERYVAESATLYNRPVTRSVIDENGEENEEATKIVNEELKKAKYDERMHKVSKIAILTRVCGLWYQVKRGALRPQIVVPSKIYPVASGDPDMDAADVEDYLGHSIELTGDTEDLSRVTARRFALLMRSETTFYESGDPYDLRVVTDTDPNPFRWPQSEGMEDRPVDLPLQMLMFWHKELPMDELLPDGDPDIVLLNRELNVQWSVILDALRNQSWGEMILNLLNPEEPPASINSGARFAVPLQVQESASFVQPNTDYTGIVGALQSLVKLIAMTKRINPGDLSVDGQAPESGFARLVQSLPKLESREELAARFKATEEQEAWPRIASSLIFLRKLSESAKKFRLVTTFADIEFPRTVDEITREQDHEIKHGLTTPARILSEKKGISIEEAQAEIDENKSSPAGVAPEGEEQPRPGDLLGSLIRQRTGR